MLQCEIREGSGATSGCQEQPKASKGGGAGVVGASTGEVATSLPSVLLESSQDVEPQKPELFCLRMSPFCCSLGPKAAEFDLLSFDLFLPLHSVYQEWMKIKVGSF